MRPHIGGALLFSMIVVCGIVISSVYVWAHSTCRIQKNALECNAERVDRVLQSKGVAAALAYVDTTILPQHGYPLAHILLHSVGDHAFSETNDLHQALEFLSPYEEYASSSQWLSGFDGYVHGVLSSYFQTVDAADFPALMKSVCGGGVKIRGITERTTTCHHALGHALVHASGNRAEPALSACDTVETDLAKKGCYYGVFMEISYLFHPEYHKGSPRPDSQGKSMGGLCSRLSGKRRASCAHFVGQTYLIVHRHDFFGAFQACAALSENRETCAFRLGHVFVIQSTATEEGVVRSCERYAGDLVNSCIQGAREGLASGFAPDVLTGSRRKGIADTIDAIFFHQ